MKEGRYKLTAVVESSDGDKLLQRVTVDEYSDDPTLHMRKNMELAAGIMGAFASMVEQAKKDLAK